MEKKSNITSKLIGSALVGGIIGGVVGLLLAPKSGQELRKDIAQQVSELENKTQLTVNNGKELIEKGKSALSNMNELVHEIRNGALKKSETITIAAESSDYKDETQDHILESTAIKSDVIHKSPENPSICFESRDNVRIIENEPIF